MLMLKKWEDLPDDLRVPEVRPYYDILRKRRFSLLVKRVFDVVCALIVLIALAVPMAVIALAIKLDSPGPVIFRQERVTKYGKTFRIHKFRTMVRDADRKGGAVTVKGDARITRVGGVVFVRKQDTVENGEIAAVVIEDEATLKRVYYYPDDAKLVLSPENPRYAPLVYVGEELDRIRILGRAVAFQSKIR